MKADEPCVRAREAVAYCLGELPAPDREAFKKHMAACRVCAQATTSFQAVIEKLRSDPEVEASPALASRIVSIIASGHTAAPSRRWRLPLQIAALFLAVLGLGLLWRPSIRRVAAPDLAAVRRNALEWLMRAQGADGGWSAGEGAVREKYAVGVSALALMALLQDGSSAKDAARSEAIRRGVEYLIRTQNEQGLFGAVFSGATYNQGLATLALIEACKAEKNQAWRGPAAKALACLRELQDERSGGWDYLRAAPGSANTSASVWPLLALLRADELGFPGVRDSIEHGLAWMKTTINAEGRMGYRRAGHAPYGSETLTAAGAACLARSGNPADAPLVETMLNALRADSGQEEMDFYRAFFTTEVLFAARQSLQEQLAALQARSGPEAGSWEPADRWGRTGGPVYATALATLCMARE